MHHFCRALAPCLLALVLALVGCGRSNGTSAVATIDRQPISHADYEHWYAIRLAQARKRCGAQRHGCVIPVQVRQQTMHELILRAWVAAEARRQNVRVNQQQLAQRVAQTEGLAPADARTAAQAQLLVDTLSQHAGAAAVTHLRPTNAQLAAFYRTHHSLFARPAMLDLQLLGASTRERAQRLREALANRLPVKPLDDRPLTTDPHGIVRGLPLPALPSAVRTALGTTHPGHVFGPVAWDKSTWVAGILLHLTPAHKAPPFQPELVRSVYLAQRQQAAAARFPQQLAKRWAPKTWCAVGYATQDCGKR